MCEAGPTPACQAQFPPIFPAETAFLDNWDDDIKRAARAAANGYPADEEDLAQVARARLIVVYRSFPDAPAGYLRAVVGNAIRSATRRRPRIFTSQSHLADPSQYGIKGAKNNRRHEIMKDYNGLLICRERRQIDTIPPRWTKFQTYDLNIKVEIVFDPELDEFFGITTAKQQIVIDDEMWEKLQQKGKNSGALVDLVEDLRHRVEEMRKELKAKFENRVTQDQPRASVAAMEQSTKFKGTISEPTPAQQEEAHRNLEEAAKKRAEVTGQPTNLILEALAEQTSKRRWELEFGAIPEGPFYRPQRLGEQKRLVINTDHPFYTKVYEAAPDVRAALEVLLFVLAERELEVKNEAEIFYKAERQRWSERLRHALDELVPEETMVNKAAAVAERMHMTADEPVAG